MNAGGEQKRAATGSGTASRKRLALVLLCLASFMAVVDTTIISIALPSMRRELGFSGADAQWILNGYALAFGGLLLLLGRAGDLWGRRRLFLAGLALFSVASLVGGLSWAPWVLVARDEGASRALGYSPLAAGLLFFPMTLASVIAASAAGRLATRFGLRTTASSGLTLVAVGFLLMARMSESGNLLFVIFGMVIEAAGFMFSNVPLTIAGSGSVGEGERGLAAGLLNTSIQLGNAWGLNIVATVVAAVAATLGGEAAGAEALVGGLRWGLLICVSSAVIALPVVLLGLPKNGLLGEQEGDGGG